MVVLAMLMVVVVGGGGVSWRKKFSFFKRGGHEKFNPVLEGDTKGFGPAIFPCYSPLPVINDRPLKLPI